MAILAGLQTEMHHNSRSTVIRDALNEITSTPLYQGQRLPIKIHPITQATECSRIQLAVPRHYIPNYLTPLTLDLLPCYQWQLLNPKQQQHLLNTTYKISSQANRMGYQLIGDSMTDLPTAQVSEGIALGSVQLPASGQPIILLQDRQTIGGYPKAGVVSALDCAKLSQRQQGVEVKFRLNNPVVCRYKMQAFKRFFNF